MIRCQIPREASYRDRVREVVPLANMPSSVVRGTVAPARAAVLAFIVLLASCTEGRDWLNGSSYPNDHSDGISDLDYCDSIAQSTFLAEERVSADIGGRFEVEGVSQGPDTLERNVAAYQAHKRYHQIIANCLRHRRSSSPPGSAR